MDKKYLILIILAFVIVARLVLFPVPFTGNVITGNDHGAHIHKIQFIKEHGSLFWDSYWYAGTPLTRFYPPLAFYVASLIPFNEIDSYNIAFMLFFALTPVIFYYLLREFRLAFKEKIIALLLFSFTMYYNSAVFFGQYPTMVSVFFSIIFLIFFIRGIKGGKHLDLCLAGLCLGLTAATHELVTIMAALVSLFYLASHYYVKRGRVLKLFSPYAIGLAVSAFWVVPFLIERAYSFFESGSPTYIGLLGSLPVVGVLRLYGGMGINLLSIAAAGLVSLLLIVALVKSLRKNVESLFLFSTTAFFLVAYFLTYLFAPAFLFDPTRFIVLWPIPFSMILARLWKVKIVKWALPLLIVYQMVLFFGTPMPVSNSWTAYQDSLAGLEKSGRVTIQPEELLYITADYIPGLSGFEEAYGNLDMGLTSNRGKFIEENRLFKCYDSIPLSQKAYSLDIFTREYAKEVPCRLYAKDYKDFFSLEFVRYVVVDKTHSEITSIFDSDLAFSRVKESSAYVVYRFNWNISYVDSRLAADVQKDFDSIILKFKSDGLEEHVPVRLSESWYPYWHSDEVQVKPDSNGFISFELPSINREKEVKITLEEPWYTSASTWASVLSILAIAVYAFISRIIAVPARRR